MKPAQIEALFERFAKANPNPMGELDYINPFTLLVAVVLSAQATDVGVNKATEKLFKVADTPQKMLALGEEGLKPYIRSLGFFNMKAKNVIALSRALIERFGGEVPAERDVLQTLPGVGRKTASVVLNTVYKQPTIAVDTHVFRVADRLGLARAPSADAVSEKLERIIPERYRLHAHHWLILHGRYVCKARKPDCPVCIVNDLCPYPAKTTLATGVVAAKKPKVDAAKAQKPGARRAGAKRAPRRNAGRNSRPVQS